MTSEQLQTPCIQYYRKPIRNTVSHEAMSVAELFRYITTDQSAMEATHRLRQISDPKEYRQFKAEHFDHACISGLFSYRSDKSLVRHSGLLCMDFDHLGSRLDSLREQLIADAHFETELLFVSPGGDGLKWVIEIDLSKADHRTWFLGVRNYVLHTYQVEADENCVNVSRACFLPHDVNCYVNPLISPF